MFHIIGVDGRQYGPASADQIRNWIAEQRANSNTPARRADETEWKTLGTLPEFATIFNPPPSFSTTQPPIRGGTAEAERIAQEILARDYDLRVFDCLSRAWDLVLSRFWLTAGVTFLIIVLIIALESIPVIGIVASLAITYVLAAGLDWFFLKLIRGHQQADVADAFVGFSVAFVPLMLFSIVAQVLVSVGFLLCILPGIYLLVAWLMLGPLLILDKNLDFWPAMELSRKVVSRHWWQFFGLFLMALLLNLLGMLACCVGLLITLPVTTAAIVYAYEDVFGNRAVAPAGLLPVQPDNPPSPDSQVPAGDI